MVDYTSSSPWDIIWNRPYSNYEKHHQLFWSKIRDVAKGKILDLGCGSGSCWKDYPQSITGVDFSKEAIYEAIKNCPGSTFLQCDLHRVMFTSHTFDTTVLCGVVNYYQNIEGIMREAARLTKPDGQIIITINVIDDFPDRHWDEERIQKEFGAYGSIHPQFFEGVGWLLVISISQ